MPTVHQWCHQDIAHLDKDYPEQLEEEGAFQPCSTIVSLQDGQPRSIYFGDTYHTYKSERGEITIHYGNILTMNNRVVHCSKMYPSVPEGQPMKLRVLYHGHIYYSYVGKDIDTLLFDNEYVHPRQIHYRNLENRMYLARCLWDKLCSVFQV
jgi:hypothetical protein